MSGRFSRGLSLGLLLAVLPWGAAGSSRPPPETLDVASGSPADHRMTRVAGTVEGSLSETIEALGERADLVAHFTAALGGRIDVAADLRPGDRFRLLVEKRYAKRQVVGYGPVFAAEYETEGGRRHTSIYFRTPEGEGYYTPAGESLQPGVLKTPLEFTRISSSYSRARRHPILGRSRPHLAVDYAASYGTPVWAAADGIVEFAGRRGDDGRTVVLAHRGALKTMYAHLSRFEKGIRRGTAVQQGAVIGYVGSSGLTTGPHLCYRVMKDGIFLDPLQRTLIPGAPVPPAWRAAFAAEREALLAALRAPGPAARPPLARLVRALGGLG